MKTTLAFFAGLLGCAATARGVLINFSYVQNDSATGSGSIAPFSYDNGGGPINFGSTSMPATTLVNPVPAATPSGFVGAMNAQMGASNEANQAVGLTWSGFVLATGTRGAQTFTMKIPLVFVPKQTQAPDISDYNWSVAFGDSASADAVSGSMRFAMIFSRDTVIDAVESPDTFQRYTQLNHTFVAGVDSFTNTDLTNATIKDASDAGVPAGNDAVGKNLAFYWGWRDQGTLNSGAILVDSFAVGGLLNSDESSLTLVPEPSGAALLLVAAGYGMRRRRRHAPSYLVPMQ